MFHTDCWMKKITLTNLENCRCHFLVDMETETSDFQYHCTFFCLSRSLFPCYSGSHHTYTEAYTAINHFTSFHKWVQKHTAHSCIEDLVSGSWKSIYTGTGHFCPHSPPAHTHARMHARTHNHSFKERYA